MYLCTLVRWAIPVVDRLLFVACHLVPLFFLVLFFFFFFLASSGADGDLQPGILEGKGQTGEDGWTKCPAWSQHVDFHGKTGHLQRVHGTEKTFFFFWGFWVTEAEILYRGT